MNMSRGNVFGRQETINTDVSVMGKLMFNGNSQQVDFSAVKPGTETSGSCITTKSTWLVHGTVGACAIKMLCSTNATSGDYATLRIRGRADAADANSARGTASIMGGDFSASANVNNHGNLIAVQGVAQPNAFTNDGSANIVCGLYGRIDATGASSGRRWVSWLDTHATTKASAGDYMQRISHNGTTANDGVWTIYTGGRLPQLINFEDVAGLLSTSSSGTFTKTHKIACKIAGDSTQYYIELGTIA
jgi:hypothetical protein